MRRAAVILYGTLLLLAATPAASVEPSVAVIVHPDRRVTLTIDDLASIYLKRRLFWSDGQPIIALNRESGSAVREHFSRRVFGSNSAHLAAYWNEHYFQGIFPPTTLSSTAAVKRYVATERNAIGYIRVDELDDSVRVVLQLE